MESKCMFEGEACLPARGFGEPWPKQPNHTGSYQDRTHWVGRLSQAVHHGQPQLQDDQEHEATGHGLWKPNATVDVRNPALPFTFIRTWPLEPTTFVAHSWNQWTRQSQYYEPELPTQWYISEQFCVDFVFEANFVNKVSWQGISEHI